MKHSALGIRMKQYEERFTSQTLLPLIPTLARMDGRAFHKFTKGLNRPFDVGFANLLIETTKFLVQETSARCGYCQSDEITLVWLNNDYKSQIFFNGRVAKMVSVLAGMVSAYFNKRLPEFIPSKVHLIPVFDARVWNVPTEAEAANCFLWRELDATKNSVSMAAQSYFSHSELMGKNTSQKHDMLHAKGVNWNDYPEFFKRGTYVRRREINTTHSAEEIENLPPKHEARLNPNLKIKRNIVIVESLPPMTKIINRESVILYGEKPLTIN